LKDTVESVDQGEIVVAEQQDDDTIVAEINTALKTLNEKLQKASEQGIEVIIFNDYQHEIGKSATAILRAELKKIAKTWRF
jgi:hypothetical protein